MHADEIDPQAKEAVERQDRFPLPHSRWGVKLARLLTRPMTWVQNRNPPAVGRTVDGTVPGPAGDLDVRLYLPDGEGPFPTVVFFHGGGFVFGSIGTHDWLCRHLTRESGCAVLSVDYRLAPEHPFPAAVADAYAAVEWAAANPDAIDGTGEVAVAGDSAGGALAAVAALMAVERDGPEIAYQALLYPGVGVEPDQPSVEEHAGTVLSESDLEWFTECYYDHELHARNPYADPTNAGDVSGVAPATVVTAGFDPLRDGGKAYAEQLVRDGVPTRYENYADQVHGFMTLREVDRATEAIADVADDLAVAFRAD
ncbi:alpha/beta hydrolase fold domain-containing protein [Halorubrum kocurii]|uniref:Alpha/beta hydrolase fold-3 domain protein n=1 Tax=Halorubrum kocurii JCM 14978 TaxID=1230456 RepID=M0P876_9EURY|nr:alpha/beta hydrolase fold domain-containing protein [Halorubrum kocurii]EMA65005.1 alpha/beta hydrolase fold-3 domain protein [Halorubrum kocurii JCM 14978]